MSERIVQQPVATETQAKFSDLPSANVERSTFDMSHPWKGTMDTNRVVPCLTQEILPGDTFNVNSTAFMRLATPLKPIMDSLTADIHYFFVPNRLVWDNWVHFMGERDQPDDDPSLLSVPQAIVDVDVDVATGWLADYFGLPLVADNGAQISVNALPYRGYHLIFNEWYRNENLEGSLTVLTDDGPDNLIGNEFYSACFVRHKRSDYFTRALPWPQKGDPVFLPLGQYAPVLPGEFPGGPQIPRFADSTELSNVGFMQLRTGDGDEVHFEGDGNADANLAWEDPRLHADLTEATAATINDIRTAFQIQRLLERDARGGTRYIEILLSHFNVQSPDFRLQRPEYIGGGSSRIIVNPVAATVATEDAPQANLAAVGTGLLKGSMNHSFTEHGFLHAFISCRADLTYQNGLDRIWSRQTRYDYYWPALSHLGEQAIKNQELFWNPDNQVENEGTFGYQERYAEYRYQQGRITGQFRSVYPESLDVWHLAQDFEELPTLGLAFVIDVPPIDRVVAVPSEPDLIVDVWHNMKATRAMPVYAVPGLVDHF